MLDELYCYPPDFIVLKNKFEITDQGNLDKVERLYATQRIKEKCPSGDFDLDHLTAIHHHIFQDIYSWAGEVRQVEISKGESDFLPSSRIDMAMDGIHKKIIGKRYFQGSDQNAFAKLVAEIIGDINYIHPFREGNGRTQLIYLQQLGAKAGHVLALETMNRDEWIQASISAQNTDYEGMFRCILKSMVKA